MQLDFLRYPRNNMKLVKHVDKYQKKLGDVFGKEKKKVKIMDNK